MAGSGAARRSQVRSGLEIAPLGRTQSERRRRLALAGGFRLLRSFGLDRLDAPTHPVPDAASVARRMLETVRDLSADDVVLCLMSGGASSLLVAPIAGLTLEDKQLVNHALLKCGASISEMNCVHRHLSAV